MAWPLTISLPPVKNDFWNIMMYKYDRRLYGNLENYLNFMKRLCVFWEKSFNICCHSYGLIFFSIFISKELFCRKMFLKLFFFSLNSWYRNSFWNPFQMEIVCCMLSILWRTLSKGTPLLLHLIWNENRSPSLIPV